MILNFDLRNDKEPIASFSPQLIELEPELDRETEMDAVRRMFGVLIFLPEIMRLIPFTENEH